MHYRYATLLKFSAEAKIIYQAVSGIRTHDLILTKDVRYPCAMTAFVPTLLLEILAQNAKNAEGRIRTAVNFRYQIYSLTPLTARPPLRISHLIQVSPTLTKIAEWRSRWQESNSQPAVYKTAALPLSYTGKTPPKDGLFRAQEIIVMLSLRPVNAKAKRKRTKSKFRPLFAQFDYTYFLIFAVVFSLAMLSSNRFCTFSLSKNGLMRGSACTSDNGITFAGIFSSTRMM